MVRERLSPPLPPWSLFGVFDGHGGDQVSTYAALKFPSVFEKMMKDREKFSAASRQGQEEEESTVTCLKKTFVELDKMIRHSNIGTVM